MSEHEQDKPDAVETPESRDSTKPAADEADEGVQPGDSVIEKDEDEDEDEDEDKDKERSARPTGLYARTMLELGAEDAVVISSSEGSVEFEAGGDIEMEARGDVEIEAGGEIELEADGDIELEAGGEIELEAAEDIELEAGGDIELEAGGDIELEADGDIELEAGGDVEIEADGSLEVDVASASVWSSSEVTLVATSDSHIATLQLGPDGLRLEAGTRSDDEDDATPSSFVASRLLLRSAGGHLFAITVDDEGGLKAERV